MKILGISGHEAQKPKKVPPLDYHRGTETILVVDDEESLRTVVVDLLGQLGYCILSAGSGQEALDLLTEICPDVVLSDVLMPDIDGVETAIRIRERCPETRILLASGGKAAVRIG